MPKNQFKKRKDAAAARKLLAIDGNSQVQNVADQNNNVFQFTSNSNATIAELVRRAAGVNVTTTDLDCTAPLTTVYDSDNLQCKALSLGSQEFLISACGEQTPSSLQTADALKSLANPVCYSGDRNLVAVGEIAGVSAGIAITTFALFAVMKRLLKCNLFCAVSKYGSVAEPLKSQEEKEPAGQAEPSTLSKALNTVFFCCRSKKKAGYSKDIGQEEVQMGNSSNNPQNNVPSDDEMSLAVKGNSNTMKLQ